jgi:hypothetical protein
LSSMHVSLEPFYIPISVVSELGACFRTGRA